MTVNSLDNAYSFADAKSLMAAEFKKLGSADGCYKEPSVVRIEIFVKDIDQLSWLSRQTSSTKIYGSHQTGQYAIAGVGEALCVSGDEVESCAKIFERLRLYLGTEHRRMQFYGGFCFDPENPGREWQHFNAYKFVVPQFEVATKDGLMIFSCNVIRHGQGTKTVEAVLLELAALRWDGKTLADVAVKLDSRRDEPTQDAWRRNVQSIF